ncbi:substrate-binding domain-containing protein [Psychromonas hadalis]|uniref:substrate-binding domain-containing protein n=1 Tax=Psychromonas hadalis TaxID=211669 RepID=UPI0003B4BE29|nr:substrate-binding domain-containing protein [Psychromonas hadalis]
MLFKKMLLLLLCCFANISSLQAHGTASYWTIDEYFQLNPAQQKLSQQFNEIVQNEAVALKQKNQPIKIFIVYPSKQISDYWRRSILAFEARLKELNINYQIRSHHTSVALSFTQQKRLLARSKEYNPDYLIFTLSITEHQGLIETIMQQQNAPKLILQNITTPLKVWADKQPFFYVGFDHIKGTQLLANYYLKLMDKKSHYAMIYWAPGYLSEVRGHSFIHLLESNSDFILSSEHYTDATRSSAYRATQKALATDHELAFIYACSTDVALGVSQAVRDAGLKDTIKVNGWGGGANELQALKKGLLDVTVMRMNDDNGVAMAEVIKLDISGKEHQVPLIYSGEFAIIDNNTSEEALTRYKKRAFRYSH